MAELVERASAGNDSARAALAPLILAGNMPSRILDGWRLPAAEEAALANAGTPEARERLALSVLGVVYAAAAKARRHAPEHLGGDIFNAAVSSVADSVARWTPERGNLAGYVYASARNAARDVLRNNLWSRWPYVYIYDIPIEDFLFSHPPDTEDVLAAIDAERGHAAPETPRPTLKLSALTPRQLEAWALLHAGHTRAEAARAMGIHRSRITQLLDGAERRILAAHGVAA